MKRIFIYILIDPRRPELVRYVGQTETPKTRHMQHCAESGKSAKAEWIEMLRMDGVMPQMVIVAEVSEDRADVEEKTWIARFSASGLLSNTVHNSTPTIKGKAENTLRTVSIGNLKDAERITISDMLKKCAGNKRETASRLGIGRQTLYNKIKEYDLRA